LDPTSGYYNRVVVRHPVAGKYFRAT